MSVVVISQPALFPWQGMVEQISLCNTYIHHDDLQYPKQWFTNRVQLKTSTGQQWITIPIERTKYSVLIKDVRVREDGWRTKHVRQFEAAYNKAPFRDDALTILQTVYETNSELLNDIAIASMYGVLSYFGLKEHITFMHSTDMHPEGAKTDRVLWLCNAVNANRYVTGHGALNYLEHEKFDDAGIDVEYMAYSKTPYPQLHGDFIPYVSSLDMIANLGPDAVSYLHPATIPWRDALASA